MTVLVVVLRLGLGVAFLNAAYRIERRSARRREREGAMNPTFRDKDEEAEPCEDDLPDTITFTLTFPDALRNIGATEGEILDLLREDVEDRR